MSQRRNPNLFPIGKIVFPLFKTFGLQVRLTCIPVVIGLCPANEEPSRSTLKQLFSVFFALLNLNGWSVAAVVGGNTGAPEVGSRPCECSVNREVVKWIEGKSVAESQ